VKVSLNTLLLATGVVLVVFALGQWSCMTRVGHLIPPSRREAALDFELPLLLAEDDGVPAETPVEPVAPADTPAEPVPVAEEGLWRLSDQLGSPVFLIFWKSWSEDFKPSSAATRITKELHETFASQGVEFVAVNHRETEFAAHGAAMRLRLPYPCLFDVAGAVSDAYNVGGYAKDVPTCLAIDAQGRIAAHFVGFNKEFEARVTSVLSALAAEAQAP
jgi:peroxiredoxin